MLAYKQKVVIIIKIKRFFRNSKNSSIEAANHKRKNSSVSMSVKAKQLNACI